MPKRFYDWREIQRFHDDGHGFVACQKRFGFSHTAWVKAIKRGELRSTEAPFRDRRRRYDWAEVQRYYDEGHSYRETQVKYGFNPMAWHKAKMRGEIRPRPLGLSIDQLPLKPRSRKVVKLVLLRAGVLKNQCDRCGLSEWLGKPLTIHVDHINGIRDDHRIENLRMLCPNCHSQTETYGGRNRPRRSGLHDRSPGV